MTVNNVSLDIIHSYRVTRSSREHSGLHMCLPFRVNTKKVFHLPVGKKYIVCSSNLIHTKPFISEYLDYRI